MRKILIVLGVCMLSLQTMAQIEMFDESVKKVEEPKALPYDSLRNITTQEYGSGENSKFTLHHLIGQTLLYCGDPYSYYKANEFEIGKYYRVDGILPDDSSKGLYHRMSLTNVESGVQTQEGSIFTRDYNFKWVVVGHYDKIKSLYINKDFVYMGTEEVFIQYEWDKANGLINLETDTVTKNIPKESVWTCVGVQVKPRKKEDYMVNDKRSPIVLIFDNPSLGKHYCYLEASDGKPYQTLQKDAPPYICGRFYTKSYYDKVKAITAANKAKRKASLINKYGSSNANLILEGKVKIGMTTEMCREAWGSPYDINKTIGSWGIHEQWVYDGSYLYFEDGILTSIQN